jgi:pyruvate dehydrogenase E1 component
MLPFYIYYSMFGFQRVGDLIWAAADQRARGFLIGATAGRTTLGGEGLQHQDGSSHLVAATVPNCRAYDPTFAYELAVILDHGMRRMMDRQMDEFYYVTVMNENYPQPSIVPGSSDQILRGMYLLRVRGSETAEAKVQLLGSGSILREVIAAADLLHDDFAITSHVFSVTSFSELARDARAAERHNRLHPDRPAQTSHLQDCLSPDVPIIAATDYVRAYAELIAAHVGRRYLALGTDGFGRSDTRAALRDFFEVDRRHIAIAAITELVREGRLHASIQQDAITRYAVNVDRAAPWTI